MDSVVLAVVLAEGGEFPLAAEAALAVEVHQEDGKIFRTVKYSAEVSYGIMNAIKRLRCRF